MRCLYVATDPDAALTQALLELGHNVCTVPPGEALWAITEDPYRVIVYDQAENDIKHFAACAMARREACMLLAVLDHATVDARIALLKAGADSCMNRPLSFLELEALLGAFLRRQALAKQVADPVMKTARLRSGSDNPQESALILHRNQHKVTYRQREISVSSREFKLLILFAESTNHLLDRQTLRQYLWNDSSEPNPALMDAAILRLRRKLSGSPVQLQTVRNVGYRLTGAFRIQ